MSAGEPGNLPDPEQLDALVDAVEPVQSAADSGGDIGTVLAKLPGSGPKALGEALQMQADILNLGINSVSLTARTLQAYVDAQASGVEAVFPPPQELARQVQADADEIARLLVEGPGGAE